MTFVRVRFRRFIGETLAAEIGSTRCNFACYCALHQRRTSREPPAVVSAKSWRAVLLVLRSGKSEWTVSLQLRERYWNAAKNKNDYRQIKSQRPSDDLAVLSMALWLNKFYEIILLIQ